MRLSIQDRNELMKAIVRASDLASLKQYLVGLVDAIDDLPEGKADAPVPRYAEPQTNGHAAAPRGEYDSLFTQLPPQPVA